MTAQLSLGLSQRDYLFQPYHFRVQLIDASDIWEPRRKSLGDKRRRISDQQIKEITKHYTEFNEGDKVKIFQNEDFGYRKVRIEQPLRLNYHAIPAEAQFSTAMSASVADYDNDGNEDIFLTQNLFGVYDTFPRQDAGRGLWLKGDGKGGFESIPGTETGVQIYGEQRGAALSDFNGDAKNDLAVTQRDSTTKLYLNTVDKRGVRVQLEGPASNSLGIGSSIRLVYPDGSKGPIREIQAGSGHWSMNSTVAVLGIKEDAEPEKLEVHWFDGTRTSISIESDQWNYKVVY